MTTLETQVRTMYDTLNLEPEIIASELQLEIETVKNTLARVSTRFREEFRKADDEDKIQYINDEEMKEITCAYKDLALNASSEFVRVRALEFLWNERKGRNDKKLGPMQGGINITELNAIIVNNKVQSNKIIDDLKNNPMIDLKTGT